MKITNFVKGRITSFQVAILFISECVLAQQNLLSARNIAALQAINTSALDLDTAVLVLGYYLPGDRGGGIFKWQPNSGATPDGGRYLVSSNPLSLAGRWARILNGEIAKIEERRVGKECRS